ncbi:MAG: hypothetical protein A2V88_02430 [Elusimicrobia bacterium RBG_16_66_12]|nr:MAG: hypothetical protein A2V88_02430 [Elusimicrobia bacterium RBG_16_66_12]
MARKLSLWLPVAAWCALIFTLSSIPYLSSGSQWDFPLRKLAHMAEYGVLFALTRRALSSSGVRARRASWASAFFCVFYAASDEWHQTFVPGRHGAAGDVAIDMAGVSAWWALSCRAWKRE